MARGLAPLAQHGSLLLGRAGPACYNTRPCRPSPFFFQAEPQAKIGGPACWTGLGEYEYFITFTDDYSRYGYVYLLCHKSEDFKNFREYKAKAEKKLSIHIKKLRFD